MRFTLSIVLPDKQSWSVSVSDDYIPRYGETVCLVHKTLEDASGTERTATYFDVVDVIYYPLKLRDRGITEETSPVHVILDGYGLQDEDIDPIVSVNNPLSLGRWEKGKMGWNTNWKKSRR